MAIGFRAAGGATSGFGANTSLEVPAPPGVAVNDVLFAVITNVTAVGGDITQTEPSGWSLVRGDHDPGSGSAGVRVNCWVRVAGGSEPASYVWTVSAGTELVGSISAYTGVDVADPVHIADSVIRSTSSTTRITPTINITMDDTWVLSYFGDRSGSTWTGPDTERRQDRMNSSASSVVCDSNGTVVQGATSRTATASTATSTGVQGIVAIKPLIAAPSRPLLRRSRLGALIQL